MILTFDTKKSSKQKQPDQSSKEDITTTTSSSILATKDDGNSESSVIQNVILQNNEVPDSKVFKFTQRKSKGGCITCKIRKKRCSEEQPICADCKRLNKNCVWAADDMNIEDIRELKKKVEQDEEESKLKRKLEFEAKKASKKQKKPNVQILEQDIDQTNAKKKKKEKKKKAPQKDNNIITDDNVLHQEQSIPHPLTSSRTSNIQDNEYHNPLDFENLSKNQTPIAANLLYLSQNSPQLLPTSPKWDSLSIPSPGSTAQFFDQFNNFIESNIRGHHHNNSNNHNVHNNNDKDQNPNKIINLDDENGDIEELPTTSTGLTTTSPNSSSTPSKTASSGFSPFFHAFDLPDNFPNFKDLSNTIQPSIYGELNLDQMGMKFYDYYINRLSNLVSIVPKELNYYRKVFLPMAAVNPGILNTILAWSAYHMGNGYEIEADKYMEKALSYINKKEIKTDGDAIQKLANSLILIGTEICRGDVSKWGSYLRMGSKVIKDRGGLFKFNHDKEQQWLISNFVYHDILASSTSERGTYFPVEDYEAFMISQLGFGVDPLQGIVKPLFNIIGEISTLASETKKLLKISSNSLGYGIMNDDDDEYKDEDFMGIPGLDNSPPGPEDSKKVTRYASLLVIMQKASVLENKINLVKPDPEDLQSFTMQELELQLTLFELFQYTAKLHLRQSVLRLNPSSLETQFILCELLKCLDIVLKSPVEGSLCFPLFIAGMNCTTKKDRKMMRARFEDILGRYSFKNIDRAKTIMENVWEIDPTGTRCVDWYEIVKSKDWDLSFA